MLLAPIMTILGWFLSVLAALMIMPSLYALSDGNTLIATSFFVSALGTLFFGGGLVLATRMETPSLSRRETFLTAVLVWALVPVFVSLPFYIGEVVPTYLDAYFEALSGFTTNGASVVDNLQNQSRAVLLWRALIQWVGGYALIIFVATLATTISLPGNNPLNQAIAKSTRRRLSRRIRFAVLSILQIYIIMTVSCILLLWASGMDPFHAMCYGFSTLSTGGFTVTDGGLELFGNRFTEIILIIFMTLGAISFSLHWAFLNGDRRSYFNNPEYRYMMFGLVFGTALMLLLLTLETDMPVYQSVRYALFNTVSALTTTGYTMDPVSASGEFFWPVGSLFLLFFLLSIGGSTGSTAGGIKLMRAALLVKQGVAEVRRLSYPSAIIVLKYGQAAITRESVLSAWGFFSLYCFSVILVAMGLAFTGLDFQAAFVLATSNIANAGAAVSSLMTGFGSDETDFTSYSALPEAAKLLLCLAMLLGRLEFFTVLALLSPSLWRR